MIKPAPAQTLMRRTLTRAPALIGALLLIASVIVIQRELRSLSFQDIRRSIDAIPIQSLLLAGLATFLSYFILSFYDWLACVHIKMRQSFRRAAFAAFCSYVLSHNLGLAAVSGAAVRFRLYRNWGIPTGGVAHIIAFCSTTYLLGATALISGIFIWEPDYIPILRHLPPIAAQIIGACGWLIVLIYIGVSFRLREIRLFNFLIEIPRPEIAVMQVLVSAADMTATALIAYVLMPSGGGPGFGTFLSIYVASYTLGLAASVPGGLGVFDGAMLYALTRWLPPSQVLGIILVFRLFYYIVPLVLAGIMFATHELFLRSDAALLTRRKKSLETWRVRRPSLAIRESEADFSVAVSTGLVSGTGVALLFYTVAVPVHILAPRFGLLTLQFAEVALSVIGVCLIGVAVGLVQRVTVAWKAAILLLTITLPLLVVREAAMPLPLAIMLIILSIAPFRACYYRRSRLVVEPLSLSLIGPVSIWILSLALMASIALHHTLGHNWWQRLIFDPDARQLRWIVAISALLGLFAVSRIFSRTLTVVAPWSPDTHTSYATLDRASQHVAHWRPHGLLITEDRKAALPFFQSREFVIGVGDPAGEVEAGTAAIWRLRDLAFERACQPCFVGVTDQFRAIYEDIGLTIFDDAGAEAGLCCSPPESWQSALHEIMSHHTARARRRPSMRNFFHVETRFTHGGKRDNATHHTREDHGVS